MTDFLRDRFPLADTSTVYMSGESVYNLVHYNKPGIIRSIELRPEQAEAFREAVREAMAEAWDEGVEATWNPDGTRNRYTENPYRDANPNPR